MADPGNGGPVPFRSPSVTISHQAWLLQLTDARGSSHKQQQQQHMSHRSIQYSRAGRISSQVHRCVYVALPWQTDDVSAGCHGNASWQQPRQAHKSQASRRRRQRLEMRERGMGWKTKAAKHMIRQAYGILWTCLISGSSIRLDTYRRTFIGLRRDFHAPWSMIHK